MATFMALVGIATASWYELRNSKLEKSGKSLKKRIGVLS